MSSLDLQAHERLRFGRVSLTSAAILTLAVCLALFRASGMWFGYPSSQRELGTIDALPQQVLLYSILPLTGAYILFAGRHFLRGFQRPPATLLFFVAWVLLSLGSALSPVAAFRGLAAVVTVSIPILLYRLRFGPDLTFRLIVRFCVWAMIVNVAYCVLFPQYGFMTGPQAGDMRGMFVHKNIFGMFCALVFALTFPGVRSGGGARDFAKWAACLLALGSAVLSRSSTALVMIALALVALAFVRSIQVLRAPSRAFALLVACYAVFLVVGFQGMGLAEAATGAVGRELTLSGRTQLWASLYDDVLARPFVGYGFAAFRQPEIVAYYTNGLSWIARSTHNTYLEIALNTGLVGAAAWVLFLLHRVALKLYLVPQTRGERALRAREFVVILLVMTAAMSEAGIMLAPTFPWALLVAFLPHSRAGAPGAEVAHASFTPRRGLGVVAAPGQAA